MTDKTILITGAANRIGAAIARGLHKRNMNIVIHYNTSTDDAQSLLSELNESRPGSAHLICADLINIKTHYALIEEAFSFKNSLDVLINNASVFYPTDIRDSSECEWDEMMAVNLRAPFYLSKYASSYLTKKNGCIINMADIHGETPLKNYPIYSITKSGLIMLTKALAKELAPTIRVNAISPGVIVWSEKMDEKTKEEILSRTVVNQKGDTEDIVNAVIYLMNQADYTTGQVLTIDGGRTLFS